MLRGIQNPIQGSKAKEEEGKESVISILQSVLGVIYY